MEKLIRWLEAHQMECSWKKYFGVECPGCGMQSAFIELLKGNLAGSFHHFPALIFLLLTLFMLIIHLIFKLPRGAQVIKILFIFTSSIMIISYLIKLFIH